MADDPHATGDATRLAGVVGSPIAHSLSPILHNAAFAELGLDWTFAAFEVAEGELGRALAGLRERGISGLSVTMPHKDAAARLADELTDAAARLGAVNCLVPDGDRLIGHNTDGGGFLDGLAHDAGIDVAGRSLLVLGAGGAARAVAEACGTAGAAEVVVANRTVERASTAAALAGPVGRAVPLADAGAAAESADVVVNATPIGMGSDDGVPIAPDLLRIGQVAVDLIYHPPETSWLATLRARGIEAHGGLSMLLFQAARAFTLWTGEEAPVSAMEAAARSALAGRSAD